jgi:hypothetical protein
MDLPTQITNKKNENDKMAQKDIIWSKSDFSNYYNQVKAYMDEIFDIGKPEMWDLTQQRLWEGFIDIETKWNQIIDIFLKNYEKENTNLKWIFFTDYPTTPISFIYNTCAYKNYLLQNHLKRHILVFNVIPLAIHYKSLNTDPLQSAYRSLFMVFKDYRYKNWQRIKKMVDDDTRFGLFHKRQEAYIPDLLEEFEDILDRKIHIDLWQGMHEKAFSDLDEIEKFVLYKM